MHKLKDLPDGTVFTVLGAPEKGAWRKLSTDATGPVVESLSKPRLLMHVDPALEVRIEEAQVG